MANGIEPKTFEHVRPPRALKYPDLGIFQNNHTAVIRNGITNMRSSCSPCQSPNHGLWFCKQFYVKDADDHWQYAKERKLCFRCLAADHRGKECRKFCTCEIDGCSRDHNRLLHGCKKLSDTRPLTTLPRVDEERHPVRHSMGGEACCDHDQLLCRNTD